jgi:DNA uptake protein ComE-like DNA-binding protein
MSNAQKESDLSGRPTEKVQPSGPHAGQHPGGLDLNLASEHEIAEIDMIGKRLAHAIVQQRAVGDGFHSWDDLERVPGLDAMKIAELKRAARIHERS